MLSPVLGPWAGVITTLMSRFGFKKDKREKLETADVQKVKIVDFQDFATSMANITKRLIIGAGAGRMTSTRTASAIAGVATTGLV